MKNDHQRSASGRVSDSVRRLLGAAASVATVIGVSTTMCSDVHRGQSQAGVVSEPKREAVQVTPGDSHLVIDENYYETSGEVQVWLPEQFNKADILVDDNVPIILKSTLSITTLRVSGRNVTHRLKLVYKGRTIAEVPFSITTDDPVILTPMAN